MNSDKDYGMGIRRGPYGTNEGDKWLSPMSELQDKFDAEGDGLVVIHEMMVKDGELQECLYVTKLPELIEEATAGHELYMARVAGEN